VTADTSPLFATLPLFSDVPMLMVHGLWSRPWLPVYVGAVEIAGGKVEHASKSLQTK